MKKINLYKNIYSKNINIIKFLRANSKLKEKDIIKISYDLQAGSYIKIYNYRKSKEILDPLINEINNNKFHSLLDFGCGDLTTLYTILKNIDCKKKVFYAYDFSFTRIWAGKKFLKKKNITIDLTCFSNNSYKIPLPNNSIDIIITSHAIEPNKNNASKVLSEIFRVAKKKIIMLEPNNNLFHLYNDSIKKKLQKRFKYHNYVFNLENKIKKLTNNYKIIYKQKHFNELNPASIFVINKDEKQSSKILFNNPNNDNDILEKNNNFYFSKISGEIFPIIDNIVVFNKNEIFIDYEMFSK